MALVKVEELARQVVAEVAAEASYLLCVNWINDKYREFVRKARPRHLVEVGELNLPAYITGGTVTTVRGSKIVTGDAAAAALWGHEHIGWHFRCKTAWYEIEAVDPTALTLTLKSGFGEEAASSESYMLVKRFHSLPEDVKWLGTMLHPRRRIPIENTHRDMLDRLYTERLAVGTLIQFWADQGTDPETGARRIEVYPPTKEYEMLAYSYYKEPEPFAPGDLLPRFLDADALKEGVKILALEHKAAKAADAGKQDIAAFYLNWAGRQRTIWLGVMRGAIIAEKGADDCSIILQVLKTRGGYGAGGDIATAREQVYANWTPLT